MMAKGDAQTNTGPWAPTQPYIKQTLQGAQNLYNQGQGFKAGPMYDYFTPYSSDTNSAISGMFNYGSGGNPLAGQSQNALSNIFNSGGGINTGGQLQGLLGNMTGQYQNLYNNSGNQAFSQALDTQAGKLTDDINREFSGLGRTGSAAQSGAIADQVGAARNQALASQWNQNVANQANILGSETNNASGILGQIGNVQGQNVANQFNAVQAAPGAWQQGLLPYQAEAQAGAAVDAQNQARQQAMQQRYNINHQGPWNRLSQYSQLVGGPGQGSQTSYTPGTNPIGGALGGGLMGAQVGQQTGLGAGFGGLIGGGLGLAANLFGF